MNIINFYLCDLTYSIAKEEMESEIDSESTFRSIIRTRIPNEQTEM